MKKKQAIAGYRVVNQTSNDIKHNFTLSVLFEYTVFYSPRINEKEVEIGVCS